MAVESPAQDTAPAGLLTPAKKEIIIRQVTTEFRAIYVFADVAEKMTADGENRLTTSAGDGNILPLMRFKKT